MFYSKHLFYESDHFIQLMKGLDHLIHKKIMINGFLHLILSANKTLFLVAFFAIMTIIMSTRYYCDSVREHLTAKLTFK